MAQEARKDLRIEVQDGYLEAHLLGPFSLGRWKEQVAAIISACKSHQRSRILLNMTALEGTLSTMDRFDLGTQGAHAASALDLKVAGFLRADQMDPQKFGVVVARNRGLRVDSFTDEQEALDWLLGETP